VHVAPIGAIGHQQPGRSPELLVGADDGAVNVCCLQNLFGAANIGLGLKYCLARCLQSLGLFSE
jgi:hypothetical protein